MVISIARRRPEVQQAGGSPGAVGETHPMTDSSANFIPDPGYAAYAAVYDVIRKALSTMLRAQGLRPPMDGGHLAAQRAVRAQFGASTGALLRPVNQTRGTRRAIEYPDRRTYIDAGEVRADLPAAVNSLSHSA
jgi:hypothetical protein